MARGGASSSSASRSVGGTWGYKLDRVCVCGGGGGGGGSEIVMDGS